MSIPAWPVIRPFLPFIAGAAVLLVAWLWFRSEISDAEQRGYTKARAEAALELEAYRQHRREIEEETQRVHAQELAKVRATAARELRGRPIRCVLGDAGEVRGKDSSELAGGAAGGSDLQSAPDLRSRIVLAGETCERMRQQLIAIKRNQDRANPPR